MSKICKNFLQKKLLLCLQIRCVVGTHLTVVYKQSSSQLGTGKYFLVWSGLKYNAEDSHGAIEIKGQLYE